MADADVTFDFSIVDGKYVIAVSTDDIEAIGYIFSEQVSESLANELEKIVEDKVFDV